MRTEILLTICFCMALCGCFGNAARLTDNDGLSVGDLKCESRTDPLGIDAAAPRMSWILSSDGYGQKQTAYRILAATEPDKLKAGQADLWDSGKVESDRTFGIVYAGSELKSEIDCYWKVRVWDKDGEPSDWSGPAMWSMGLLDREDWQAEWIGFDVRDKKNGLPKVIEKASWIWTADQRGQNVPVGQCYFRKNFQVPKDFTVDRAMAYVSADNSFELNLNGLPVGQGKDWEVIKPIDISDEVQTGRNVVAVSAENVGSSANPAGLLAVIVIESDAGETLEFVTNEQWISSSTEEDGWTQVEHNTASWSASRTLGPYGCKPWGEVGTDVKELPPARYLRRSFAVQEKRIAKARLYATALGIYQMFVNGQRVTEDYFSPGWTDYEKRIYYRTYDVTDMIKQGNNAVGAILADGWFAGYVGYGGQRNHYGKKLRLLSQLHITYDDGSSQVVASGPDWKASLGPIGYADFLMGESYDARLEMPGWDTADFDDAEWRKVAVGGEEVQPKIQAAVHQPVIVFEKVKPVSVTEPKPGQYVFDMGQNFAGVVRIQINGESGQKITLRHAEWLQSDGTIYTENLRSADATDIYICKGNGEETWQPYFTFHGFQYVEVTGLDAKPDLDMLTGLALSSDTPTAGTFECSDPMVNKIQQNSVWTQRANFIDIPTDCPQRDERLGWTGDAQVYINTACYHNDVHAFFTKWLVDLEDAQRADGQFPRVAPLKVAGADGGPAWADAGVICPWTIYKMYGDERVLEKHYEAMKEFIEFRKNRCTDELLPPARFHCYGDWLNIDDNTPKDVIFMSYFAYSTDLLARTARVLGYEDDAAAYDKLFEKIKASFNEAYVAEDGKIKGDSQTAYVLAIAHDLLDEDMQKKAAEHLLRRIDENDGHLSTGFIGTKDLMLVLAKIGRNDVAYKLLHNDTFPSWGFSIKHGATSIWERWNGWTPDEGFANPGMNSFAHYSFGAVCQWMFENIGGIRTEGAGFENIVLKPRPGGELKWAKTRYDSVRGTIETDWKLDGKHFNCTVVIPPNTTAEVHMPAITKQSVQAEPFGKVISFDDGVAVLELKSGRYELQSNIAME
ncbi:Bacterial alpha-L-rhamnosidase [Anaerohalosphaera lusitana]|uniref:alpha-L-rhamnosidase n=1 Tax=Anaerohalosphaera lusitana TaxID=1936003 RepID=A0A1U9NI44_9BACT|nr:glycoside hydrolase family 78 protein [Anaerohalosphaera lusitana]AQT67447.1 Bacterial alpha-L-rhamnosidase [Anaerohalosphaera lusitana]